MRITPGLLLCSLVPFAGAAFAAPSISTIANAASNIAYNSPIAQGSIFVITGTGLGPASLAISPAPFKSTTLNGTSVAVTVGGTTVNALMYYTSATQIAALLPSNTPLPAPGATAPSFTVTYNGETSPAVNHGMTASNVGVFTVDSSGGGPGIVTFADYSLVSAGKATPCGGPNTACGSANPGDTLILWATGLGPVNGDDASGAGLGQNMPNLALTLWLGGIKAKVVYQGRSGCCIGEDQIVFVVPDDAPTGCAVPLTVQIGSTTNTISNTTLIPVAKGSRDCTPVDPAFASVNVEQTVMSGPVSYGLFEIHHAANDNDAGFHDQIRSEFNRITGYAPGSQPFFLTYIDPIPLGTCSVVSGSNGGEPPITAITPLDGGSSYNIRGPAGALNVQRNGDRNVTLSAAGTFLTPGAFTITGAGGADVGSYAATFTIPPSPTLNTPALNANFSITRSNGLVVTWNGNGSGGSVEIDISSAIDPAFAAGSTVICRAPASAGTFSIPPYILLSLPASTFTFFEFGAGAFVQAVSAPFTASGLNIGFIQVFLDGVRTGGFQIR